MDEIVLQTFSMHIQSRLIKNNESRNDKPGKAKNTIIEMDDPEISGRDPDIERIDDELISKGGTSTVWYMKYS